MILFHDPNDFFLKLLLYKKQHTLIHGEKIFESLVRTITLCADNLDQRETRKVLFVSDVFTVMTDGIICKLTRSDIEEARTFLLLRFGIHTLVTNNRTETLKMMLPVFKRKDQLFQRLCVSEF